MKKVYRAKCFQTGEIWEDDDLKKIYKIAYGQLRGYIEEARAECRDYRCDMIITSLTVIQLGFFYQEKIMGLTQVCCDGDKTDVRFFRCVI